jgi:hypothetical protein
VAVGILRVTGTSLERQSPYGCYAEIDGPS